jgi:murein DD-endopeptidase MepM/ murein hydrolase activator NlpD
MNGSGLPDEASLNYDPIRLADPRQPLQPDLDKSIDDYVSAHPDLKNGDLITIEEPGLSGYTVCVQDDCVQTGQQGNFSLPNKSGASRAYIKITDPNAGAPALAMRYINQWKKVVVIPAYEMNGVQVPEQHLNDTTVIPLGNGISITLGVENNVGLMQGFLTLPYQQNLDNKPILWTYTDLDLRIGYRLDWTGNNNQVWIGDQTIWNDVIPGVYDQHQGTDWVMPVGTPIIAMAYGTIFNSEGGYPNNYARYVRQTIDITGVPEVYLITYGHNSTNLVNVGDFVRRGQIIGLSGNDAGLIITNPHLHLSYWDVPRNIWDKYSTLPELGDFLFGRGIFSNNGRSVEYVNGSTVAMDYCPFENRLFTTGSNSTFSK